MFTAVVNGFRFNARMTPFRSVSLVPGASATRLRF
jgi:hypothetical protein